MTNGYDITASISFKCRECNSRSKIVKNDSTIESVICTVCSITVDGEEAQAMYEELRLKYVKQMGRNVVRRNLRKIGMGNQPITSVGHEFSDPRWPFVLEINSQL